MFSSWSVAVLALAIEFKIKIVVSLMISVVVYLSQRVHYPEFFQRVGQGLRDILPQNIVRFFAQLHDQLSHEDMVFYLKSFAHFAEFITGIFLFVNAVWIFLFESASAIRAIGMAIHAYFNIWCEAKKGYRVYCQRRTASRKIESLTDATEDQLQLRRDDVCAICYEEMESAKVTHCGHLFHAVCLRKWLYVQNTCPLCHEVLYAEEAVSDVQRRERNNGQIHLNGAHPRAVNNNQLNLPARDPLANPPVVSSARVYNGISFRTPRGGQNTSSDDSDGDEDSSSGAWTDVEYVEVDYSDAEEGEPAPRVPIPNFSGASQRRPDDNHPNENNQRDNGSSGRLFMRI